MGKVASIDKRRYGRLLAKALPRVIRSDEELERMIGLLESIGVPERELTVEENELADLVTTLIQDYDDRIDLPDVPAHEMLKFLMKQRGLKQADLSDLIGSRAQVSALVNGRRAISNLQATKLAAFFHVPPDLFL